jgi:hypothetical protein
VVVWVFGCTSYPNLSVTTPHKLAPRSTRCVFIGYSPDHKGYRCLDLFTNHIVISRHVIFDEACFPFAASPHLTNDYEFLSEMDLMLSPIRTQLSAGTPMTTIGGLTTPSGGLTASITEDGDSIARPIGGSTAPPSGLTARVIEGGGQTMPLGGRPPVLQRLMVRPPSLVVQPPCPTAPTISPSPRVTMMTLTSPSAPHVAPMTPALTSSPRATLMTPPIASLAAPISPPAAQPVPRVLPAGAVLISLVVHPHLMQIRGVVGFWQPNLYITTTLSPFPKSVWGALADHH